jgi:assimilatory nitrate reductase catalytic subunit
VQARYEVRVTDDVLPRTVFVPFHWGAHRHAGGSINTLLDATADPRSKQPGLKFQAVLVRPSVEGASPTAKSAA